MAAEDLLTAFKVSFVKSGLLSTDGFLQRLVVGNERPKDSGEKKADRKKEEKGLFEKKKEKKEEEEDFFFLSLCYGGFFFLLAGVLSPVNH